MAGKTFKSQHYTMEARGRRFEILRMSLGWYWLEEGEPVVHGPYEQKRVIVEELEQLVRPRLRRKGAPQRLGRRPEAVQALRSLNTHLESLQGTQGTA